MIVKGTYFQNSEEKPLVYGDVEIHNIPRRRLRGEEEKEGIIAESVFVGFCGTDYTLMNMGREGNLKQKFPEGCNRLIVSYEMYKEEQLFYDDEGFTFSFTDYGGVPGNWTYQIKYKEIEGLIDYPNISMIRI